MVMLLVPYPPTFRFQEEREPAEYVEQLAEQMLPTTRYDDIHILKGPYVMENWDPEMIGVSALKPVLKSNLAGWRCEAQTNLTPMLFPYSSSLVRFI